MRAVLLALLCGVLVAADRTGVPELIRLTGHLGAPHAGETGTTSLVLAVGGTDRPFQLRQLDVVTGNRSASEVLSQITPVKPSFYLRAPASVLAPLGDASPGATLVIQGFLRRDGGRNLQVNEVRVTPPVKCRRSCAVTSSRAKRTSPPGNVSRRRARPAPNR